MAEEEESATARQNFLDSGCWMLTRPSIGMELPVTGRGAGCQQEHGEPFMAAAQYQAAPEPHF
jgi:hypothetical protein